MKNYFQRDRHWREIRIRLHDVGHVLPPFLDNRIITQILRRLLAVLTLDCEKRVAFSVQKDCVIANARYCLIVFSAQAKSHYAGEYILHESRSSISF